MKLLNILASIAAVAFFLWMLVSYLSLPIVTVDSVTGEYVNCIIEGQSYDYNDAPCQGLKKFVTEYVAPVE